MTGALQRGPLKLLCFPRLRTRPLGDSESTTQLICGTRSKLRPTRFFHATASHYNRLRQLTRTRSDMFCPKTNFAPSSVLLAGFFELKEQERRGEKKNVLMEVKYRLGGGAKSTPRRLIRITLE